MSAVQIGTPPPRTPVRTAPRSVPTSIGDIRRAMAAAGHPMFQPGSIRAFERRWSSRLYPQADGSVLFVESERWPAEGRMYCVCRLDAQRGRHGSRFLRENISDWPSPAQAHRFAHLVSSGIGQDAAQWLVHHGLRATETNRTWAALAVLARIGRQP